MSEQLIMKQAWHCSSAVQWYKRQSTEQQQEVTSKMNVMSQNLVPF